MRTQKHGCWMAARALFGAFALMAGCGSGLAEEVPKRGGKLIYAVVSEPPTWDCHAGNTFAILYHVAPHYSTLLKIDPHKYPELTGDLAENWEVKDNSQTFIFKLREGVKFHDGSSFSSADVKATYERLRNPPPGIVSVRRGQFTDLDTIETPDAKTVVFKTKGPNASMLTMFASPWNCIYSAAKLAQDPNFPARNIVGTGPFKFVSSVPGSKWVGTRFDDYFKQGQPYLDGFEAVIVNNNALVNSMIGGQVMAEFRGVSPAEKDTLKSGLGDKIHIQETARQASFMVMFNTKRKPFDDPRVRRALSLAVDRWGGGPQLAKRSIAGENGGLFRDGSPFARSTLELEKLPGYGRDINAARAEARRLLKEAGQENLKFRLVNINVAQPFSSHGIFVIDQWRQIGVTVEQDIFDNTRWSSTRFAGNFDAIMEFLAEYADDPSLQLLPFISAKRSPANTGRSSDGVLDDLYDKQMREIDPVGRKALVHDFERRVMEEAYIVPLFWGVRLVPHFTKVRGHISTPSIHINQDLAEVWLSE